MNSRVASPIRAVTWTSNVVLRVASRLPRSPGIRRIQAGGLQRTGGILERGVILSAIHAVRSGALLDDGGGDGRNPRPESIAARSRRRC